MWDLRTLQEYISWVQSLQPQMTGEAEGLLMRYYQLQRQSACRDAARTTVRMFESLIRIAQVMQLPLETVPINFRITRKVANDA